MRWVSGGGTFEKGSAFLDVQNGKPPREVSCSVIEYLFPFVQVLDHLSSEALARSLSRSCTARFRSQDQDLYETGRYAITLQRNLSWRLPFEHHEC